MDSIALEYKIHTEVKFFLGGLGGMPDLPIFFGSPAVGFF